MVNKKIQDVLLKQHYRIVGNHSAVQICRYTKKSLRGESICYKEEFYGVPCHQCCQMTPSVIWCQNKCLHCWRAIELTLGNKINIKKDSPEKIIDGCIELQRKLLIGFKNAKKTDMKKWREAQNPKSFAISLAGEPTLYPKLGELIKELRKRKIISFLVTNGLCPERIKKISVKKQLPTQLYISVNAPNKQIYKKIHRSYEKNAWEKLNESIGYFSKIKNETRTVVRINLIRDLNMFTEDAKNYAELIKKAEPKFVEVKGFMSVGFSRQRLGYEKMPWHKEVVEYSKEILKHLKKEKYKILGQKEESRVVIIGKRKSDLKIKRREI